MNILTHYTRRCLKQNRVRTLVTIVGIILSVALFTAVAEGAYSGQQYLMNVAIANEGGYYGMFDEISDAELADLRSQKEVDQIATLDGIGWAQVASESRGCPYLRIRSMSDTFTDMVPVELLEGRMPQNDRELLISDRAAPCTGADLAVGQTLTLSVGQRVEKNGNPLGEHEWSLDEDGQLADAFEDTWTIVGMYHRFNRDIESYEMPGTLALTVGGTGTDHKAFFTLDNIRNTLDFLAEHNYGSFNCFNDDLLLYAGISENGRLESVFSNLVAILFGLIFLGSVALIYNSFSISVSERTKQFGLLKSIGATNRQIRRTVLMEALLLCLIGIPLGLLVGCGGIGLTLRLLQPAFSRMISNNSSADQVTIRLVLHAPSLLLAGGIGLFTALVSAWIPSKRATRLSPISAIRQSADVKVRPREVKVSPLTGKIFGFSGTLAAKNFKRSRKQYRSTVISLFMSIVLFVSAFSFADYLRKDVAENVEDFVPDLIVYQKDESSEAMMHPADSLEQLVGSGNEAENSILDQAASLTEQLRSANHVEDAMWGLIHSAQLKCPASAMSQAVKGTELRSDSAFYYLSPTFFFLPEEDYRALCAKAGVDPETRQAVAYANQHLMTSYSDGSRTYQILPVFRDDAIPLTLNLDVVRPREGMVYIEPKYDDSNAPYGMEDESKLLGYSFVPEEALERGFGDADYVLIPPEEAGERTELVIGGLLKERPLASGQQELTIYLPLSGAEKLWQAALPFGQSTKSAIFMKAPEHEAAKAEVDEVLQVQELNNSYYAHDTRDGKEDTLAFLLVLNVFTFGFITLISLIAAANVFNTISTNVALRRREFATLKSVGMGNKAFGRMMRFECLLYGTKALLWGIPVSAGISLLIWKAVSSAFLGPYRMPWLAIAIAAGSVFLVVFATMLYATSKIKKDNPIDAMKQETL